MEGVGRRRCLREDKMYFIDEKQVTTASTGKNGQLHTHHNAQFKTSPIIASLMLTKHSTTTT
jgi:hypothetical protein